MNENFKSHTLHRLRDETYLEDNGASLESIVNRLIPKFEIEDKTKIDFTKGPAFNYYIATLRGDEGRGLTGAAKKRFKNDLLYMNKWKPL